MSAKTEINIKDYPIIELQVNDIKKDPNNPNVMTLEQMNGLEKSIIHFGRLKHIVVDQDNILIDGEHRLEVEKAIGTTKVNVIQVQVKDEIERKIIRETLNKLHGTYNKEKESNELLAIFENQRLDELAELLAQPKQELEELITKHHPETKFIREEDDAELPSLFKDTETFVKRGEMWQLGKHKILCEDSTNIENLDLLLEHKKADMIFTDPPYFILGSSTGFTTEHGDDSMVKPFFNNMLNSISYISKYNCHSYICCNWRSFPTLYQLTKTKKFELTPRNCIVWSKPNMRLGGYYSSSHEFIYFIEKLQTQRGLSTQDSYSKRVNGDTNVWIHNTITNLSEKDHGAQKPIDVVKRALNNSSEENDLIVDPFLGSGSTLIACEQTNRICYGMEIDEHYCSVIIKRWENYTGLKAEKIQT